MDDVSTALLESVQTDFRRNINANKRLAEISKQIGAGKGRYVDAGDYAYEVGGALAEAFGAQISSAVLPEGKMFYNIAEDVVVPMLRETHEIVSDAAMQVQQAINADAGIGILPQTIPLNQQRVNGIIDKVSNDDVFDNVAWVLNEPVKTFAQSVVDETLKANVDFQGKAGLEPEIVRRAESKCCAWCACLEGVYKYPDVPKDVYRRHNRCRCAVEYDPKTTERQNVWTKRWQTAEESDKIEARKAYGNAETALPLRILRGSGGTIDAGEGIVHKYLGTVDPTDAKTIEQLQDAFCKNYASSPVENMMVITKNGEVHFITDNSRNGVDCSYLGDKLKDSYNIHSHPPEATQFSFSTDVDIPNFFADGSEVMEAVDYKYRYRFERPQQITLEQWNESRAYVDDMISQYYKAYGCTEENYEELIQHIRISETCKHLQINGYERRCR